jgi:hypothetical protein
MKKLSNRFALLLTLVTALLLVMALPVAGDDGVVTSYTELAQNPDGRVIAGDPVAPQANGGSITVYTDRASFDAATGTQMEDDFASSRVGPNSVCADTSIPWSSSTDSTCYAPGDLIEGFAATPSGDDNVLATTGFLGIGCNAIGPNTFTDNFTLDITGPAIYGVAFGVVGDLVNPVTINIDVYGANGLIGTSSSAGTINGTFWGVTADEPITQIATAATAADGADLYCDLVLAYREPTDVSLTSFDGSGMNPAPFIALFAVVLVGFGVMVSRRKEA